MHRRTQQEHMPVILNIQSTEELLTPLQKIEQNLLFKISTTYIDSAMQNSILQCYKIVSIFLQLKSL